MAVSSGPAICVAGMHRAGTSLIARLLNLCGLWLGDDDDLVPPAPDNPAGFWEHIAFVGVNELILGTHGGTWNRPPTLPEGWADRRTLDDLLLAAREFAVRLAIAGRWGWKDPRNSLTIPFWRRIVPGMRVVVCLRHPLEVASSLHARDGFPLGAGLALWAHYYRTLLADTSPSERIVTHYATYFDAPLPELCRLLDFVDLSPTPATIRHALTAVGPELRHQRAEPTGRPVPPIPAGVAALYETLCSEADGAERTVAEPLRIGEPSKGLTPF